MPGYLVTRELFVPCYCGATEGAQSATDWWEPGVGAEPAAPVEDAHGKTYTYIGCGICIVFLHKIECVNMVLRILNLKGHQNCIINSKVTTFLYMIN